jgi:hypothetical protein
VIKKLIKAALKISIGIAAIFMAQAVCAQSNQEIAKEVANPLTSLTYLPLQLNYDSDIGPADDGERISLNIQPLTSFSIHDDWNIISRTIVPLVKQKDIFPGAGSQSGLGGVVQSVFFSPDQTTDGWTWGAGPVLLLPTATDDLLGADQWGLGPTIVGVKVSGPWTYGVLANHIASFAGDDNKSDVSATFVQPFLDYTTSNGVTYELTSESTYDWKSDQWTVPVVATVNILTQVGNQLIMYGGGLRYWVKSTESDPEGWSFNLVLYLLFP